MRILDGDGKGPGGAGDNFLGYLAAYSGNFALETPHPCFTRIFVNNFAQPLFAKSKLVSF